MGRLFGFTADAQRYHAQVAKDETKAERLDRELEELLQGLRVLLPGVQVLFAFLLTVPFSQRFEKVSGSDQGIFLAALLCAATRSPRPRGRRSLVRRRASGQRGRATRTRASAAPGRIGGSREPNGGPRSGCRRHPCARPTASIRPGLERSGAVERCLAQPGCRGCTKSHRLRRTACSRLRRWARGRLRRGSARRRSRRSGFATDHHPRE
jgi:hypothetical protein